MKLYVGQLMQQVDAAFKAGAITGAQTIAFHRRLTPWAQKYGTTSYIETDELQQGLKDIEHDLQYWVNKKTQTQTEVQNHADRQGTPSAGEAEDRRRSGPRFLGRD